MEVDLDYGSHDGAVDAARAMECAKHYGANVLPPLLRYLLTLAVKSITLFSMMTPAQMTARLISLGFVHGDQEADLGLRREWLIYLKRRTGGPSPVPFQYQHLWLTTYDDRFVESILYVYSKPFNSRAKPPMQPLHCSIYRTMEEIEVAVGKVYEEKGPTI